MTSADYCSPCQGSYCTRHYHIQEERDEGGYTDWWELSAREDTSTARSVSERLLPNL